MSDLLDEVIAGLAANRLLVDTNLMVLHVVGRYRRELIGRFKRVQNYTAEDFELLQYILSRFSAVVGTPNTWTEVSNLVGQLGEPGRRACLAELRRLVEAIPSEEYVSSLQATRQPAFDRLGLTDMCLELVAQKPVAVVTDDLALYLHLSSLELPVMNFNHFRFVS